MTKYLAKPFYWSEVVSVIEQIVGMSDACKTVDAVCDETIVAASNKMRAATPSSGLKAYERIAIETALEEARGDIVVAARSVGVSRATFYRKMAEHGIVAKRVVNASSGGPTHGKSGSGQSQI